ncbi:hypothetical protein C8R45DRAFT_988077 [Mycena sanguinolenta]|nr:hypothetical protein C8R45DRAFT_988077 [Mycena sanguinolenta]
MAQLETSDMLPNETQVFTATFDGKGNLYTLSTDRAKLDIDYIFAFMKEKSYWAKDRTKEDVIRSIQGSLSYGIYHEDKQVGFARVVTDMTTLAYLMDVFVDGDHGKRGLGTWIAKDVRGHPDIRGSAVWRLATADAHKVYEWAGWDVMKHPEWMMEVITAFEKQEPQAA